MEDGRYLIFYTFDEEAARADDRTLPRRADAPAASGTHGASDEGASDERGEEEERRV